MGCCCNRDKEAKAVSCESNSFTDQYTDYDLVKVTKALQELKKTDAVRPLQLDTNPLHMKRIQNRNSPSTSPAPSLPTIS